MCTQLMGSGHYGRLVAPIAVPTPDNTNEHYKEDDDSRSKR
jgi:hypothetical protein